MPLADRRAEIGDAVALEALDDRLQRLFRHVVAFLAERLLQDLAAEFHVLLALLQAHEAAHARLGFAADDELLPIGRRCLRLRGDDLALVAVLQRRAWPER